MAKSAALSPNQSGMKTWNGCFESLYARISAPWIVWFMEEY